MTDIDHLILKVNDLEASLHFYTHVMGFTHTGDDGPFSVVRISDTFQMQLAPWGTPGFEHYAFAVSRVDFDEIFSRVKAAGLDYGPTFDSVGDNGDPGIETGARGAAPTLYFNDPNQHLIEIRTYD